MKLVMESEAFGREEFEYDTRQEAEAAQRRIEAKIAASKDGVKRTFTIIDEPTAFVQITRHAADARAQGYAIVIFTPEELAGANVNRVQDRLVELGWDVIADLKPGPTDLDNAVTASATLSPAALVEAAREAEKLNAPVSDCVPGGLSRRYLSEEEQETVA